MIGYHFGQIIINTCKKKEEISRKKEKQTNNL